MCACEATASPSGPDVTGSTIRDETVIDNDAIFAIYVAFPGKATPAVTNDSNINFDNEGSGATTDEDAACTGTFGAPAAPSGKVCIYPLNSSGVDGITGEHNFVNGSDGFYVRAASDQAAGQDMSAPFFWAFNAP